MLPFFLMMNQTENLIQYLSQFLLERRLELMINVLNNRTRYVTVMMEDIGQSQNASAVVRTCECMGIQDIHVVENGNQYQYNPYVAMGAGKWVHLKKFNEHENNSLDALNYLKQQGYRIIATVPGENCISLPNLDIDKGKMAFVFGSERKGISKIVRENADELLSIPMYGFTESYNISVSAAIILSSIFERLHKSAIDWKLSKPERDELHLEWLKLSIKRPELLIEEFLKIQQL
jgi:tRNA (guanosine-2'-O-)-methyltransferase